MGFQRLESEILSKKTDILETQKEAERLAKLCQQPLVSQKASKILTEWQKVKSDCSVMAAELEKEIDVIITIAVSENCIKFHFRNIMSTIK